MLMLGHIPCAAPPLVFFYCLTLLGIATQIFCVIVLLYKEAVLLE